MTHPTSNTVTYTDGHGCTYELTVTVPNPMLAPNSGELVGHCWELVKSLHAFGYPGDPTTALAEHEWHGSAFEEHFYPSTEESDD